VLLLAFDTATPAVTVALHDGQRVLAEAVTVDARRHGELLAPSIAKVIADAGAEPGDLTAIATGVGPGPYTGLRVGVVTARVFGRTLGVPVYGVCTLDFLARAAVSAAAGREFLAVTDARRKELYWARYDGSGARLSGPSVSRAADIPDGAVLPVAGQAAALYPAELGEPIWREHPSAAVLAELAAERLSVPGAGLSAPGPDLSGPGTDPNGPWTDLSGPGAGQVLLPPEPLYLRRPDARVPGPPKRVTSP
jgi:tRNA threonylcarbamoyl adenosine modification protein YeaZ